MISGIMPCSGWLETGYPFQQALQCWSRVCDEIIIVYYNDGKLKELSEVTKKFPNVIIHSVLAPPLDGFATYGTYLLLGLFYCHEPDWVLSIEADFMISPMNGNYLRSILNNAKPEEEILLTDVVSCNYTGTRAVYQTEFRKYFPPYNGYIWHRPIGYRPKRGILPIPYEADIKGMNCEGLISLQAGKWGKVFHSKFTNSNPCNFNLLRLSVPVEHLTFTRSPEVFKKKMSHPHWTFNDVDTKKVIDGNIPIPYIYQELEEIRRKYEPLVPQLL